MKVSISQFEQSFASYTKIISSTQFRSDMRVLVTGGNGFIGAHVLNRFISTEHDVICVDVVGPSPITSNIREKAEFKVGDITDYKQMDELIASCNPDCIIHLASALDQQSRSNFRDASLVNIQGSINILEIARRNSVNRVVFASSVSSYGKIPKYCDRLSESITQRPTDFYGLTKHIVERIGMFYHDQYGLQFISLQPVHGIGPGRSSGNIADAYLIKAAVNGTPVQVPAQRRNFEIIYVTDVAEAFFKASVNEKSRSGKYLVGTGQTLNLKEIAEILQSHLPYFSFREGESAHEFAYFPHPPTDTTKIQSELGWEPRYSANGAILTYVRWLKSNPEKWTIDEDTTPWDNVFGTQTNDPSRN